LNVKIFFDEMYLIKDETYLLSENVCAALLNLFEGKEWHVNVDEHQIRPQPIILKSILIQNLVTKVYTEAWALGQVFKQASGTAYPLFNLP